MSVSQKQKSIASLHLAAQERLGLATILEISTKSMQDVGRRLSAFNMRVSLLKGGLSTVESAYQGAKVFTGGGPYVELVHADARTARTDERLRTSGKLLRFELEGALWPLEPPTAFYDWLYLSALACDPELAQEVMRFDAFTDIEFNPERSLNCQARSAALYCSLVKSDQIEEAMSSPAHFREALRGEAHGILQAPLI